MTQTTIRQAYCVASWHSPNFGKSQGAAVILDDFGNHLHRLFVFAPSWRMKEHIYLSRIEGLTAFDDQKHELLAYRATILPKPIESVERDCPVRFT